MADQGNSKEVCYFDGGFRRTVLQEYHHSSTRIHENYREKSPRNAMRTPQTLAVVSLTLTLTRLFDMLAPTKITGNGLAIRLNEKLGRLKDSCSFPWVCAPPFVFTVILS